MAGVAIHGSNITEVVKPNHVTYDIETYSYVGDYCCGGYDEFGVCMGWCPSYDWVSAGSGSTGAKITGTVSAPTSAMKIQGDNVAKVGDSTIETWIADPPVPSDTSSTRYRNISPGTSGSGNGSITGGSSKGNLNSSDIALVGSQVTTHLGVTTTIQNGNTKINFSS